ncbi:hypothetical protein H5410_001956 [Solanum commersonii]|uniref:Uncharacterized protein n=1 Tax=Solanum commersonii TaxID=4109 RepID=A0A9J6B1J3_SOLCO|nr:hypothetical protein H5410_001956 [Solanum commersonii]
MHLHDQLKAQLEEHKRKISLDPSRVLPNVTGSQNHDRYPGITFPLSCPTTISLCSEIILLN